MNPIHKSEHPWLIPLVVISSLFIIGAGFGGYYIGTQQQIPVQPAPISPTIVQQQACTREAKICPDGSSVGRNGPNCEFTSCPEVQITTTKSDECMIAGCSGELCVEKTLNPQSDGLATICQYKDEYACLKASRCEKQNDGTCGWTNTQEYTVCLNSVSKTP